MDFRQALKRFSDAVDKLYENDISLDQGGSIITDFSEKKKAYYLAAFKSAKAELLRQNLDLLATEDNQETIAQLKLLLNGVPEEQNVESLRAICRDLNKLDKEVNYPKRSKTLTFHIKNLPSAIREEVNLDLNEMEKAFKANCYRASVILCGRILETCLHRKYYEITEHDVLEKSPGIGLGNLIAKMREKNIALDPALSQQIHLINQVRIYSVHRKKETFSPTKDQTQAIILYTMDSINKLF